MEPLKDYFDTLFDLLADLQDELHILRYDLIDDDVKSAEETLNRCFTILNNIIGE